MSWNSVKRGEVLLMLHEQGFTYTQIAAMCGVSPQRIGQRMQVAREQQSAVIHPYCRVCGTYWESRPEGMYCPTCDLDPLTKHAQMVHCQCCFQSTE